MCIFPYWSLFVIKSVFIFYCIVSDPGLSLILYLCTASHKQFAGEKFIESRIYRNRQTRGEFREASIIN